ncbi:hypothetical protein [Sulfurimonas sp.]|uniref:hypothetical protein n=1 Tax=Sulfurimonas sp. TaxID=2022749 RepID=UPI0039E258F9
MDNPFESGHIKNYMLLYGSVVVIMVLFFIASTLFNDVKDLEKKVFSTEMKIEETKETEIESQEDEKPKFKLLEVNPQNYSRNKSSSEVKKSQ